MRERLRLRPGLLERLHWRTVETWSSDWLRDPASARQELLREVGESVGRPLIRRKDDPLVRASPSIGDGDGDNPAPQPAKDPVTVLEAGEVPQRIGVGSRHPIVFRINASESFAEARASARWERLVLPLVDFLAHNGGSAGTSTVAEVLNFQRYRIQGVVAEVQAHLNVGQHEVLRFDQKSQRIQLDLALLEQICRAT